MPYSKEAITNDGPHDLVNVDAGGQTDIKIQSTQTPPPRAWSMWRDTDSWRKGEGIERREGFLTIGSRIRRMSFPLWRDPSSVEYTGMRWVADEGVAH